LPVNRDGVRSPEDRNGDRPSVNRDSDPSSEGRDGNRLPVNRDRTSREPASPAAMELLAKADGLRRAHRLDEAARTYRQLAALPEGKPLAEEALLRAALALSDLGRAQDAIDVLANARATFAQAGELAPERTALEIRLLLKLGRALDAAHRFSDPSLAGIDSLELRTRRVEVAEALCGSAPDLALDILAPVFAASGPESLLHRADSIRARIRQQAEGRNR
jgi:hypothetical protein